ncbi:hypothetical protein [Marinobacterium sediminicola]|uniref:Sarcosine oxidase subunit gamma n=1 Tax=Marinobacterium sediminicola TaxID=518898 RepID=A0ABY1S1M6_9GAMM|nr:hypothetical protein [Marinobacterium sediminicola]ULG69442.1 hypothetical protein LN244_01115 [Marinobacterium sediminicola]SMR75592.1 hypothetical protein SAMN04487964_110130 [Marinobacterium sediminicola]
MSTLRLNETERASYLLTGPASRAALAAAGLPVPEQLLTAEERPGALVARTGRDEYMAMLKAGHPAPQDEWCFRRYDCVFELAGRGWVELMTHLCQYDFRQLQPGDWLMTSAAGVSCWLYHEIESGNLLIGADPGYRHYLIETFSAVLDDLSATRNPTGGAS